MACLGTSWVGSDARAGGHTRGLHGAPLSPTLCPCLPQVKSMCRSADLPDSIPLLSPSVFPRCSWWAAAACSNQQIRQTCVRKSLICAFAIAFIISVMLIAANQVLRSGMK